MIETLESRRMMSVTVTEGYPGYWTAEGTNGNDYITVSIDQTNKNFTLNGTTYNNTNGVNYLTINGHDGTDQVTVNQVGTGPIGATINEGNGNDTIRLNVSGAVNMGNGDSYVYMKNSFEGEVYVGTGSNHIYVQGSCPDAYVSVSNTLTAHGNNYIDATQCSNGVTITAGYGLDTVWGSSHDDLIYAGNNGGNTINTYGGADTVYAHNSFQDWLTGTSAATTYCDYVDTVTGFGSVNRS